MPGTAMEYIRERYKAHCDRMPKGVWSNPYGVNAAATAFAVQIAEAVGLCDDKGRKFLTEAKGNKLAPEKDRIHKPTDFHFGQLAEAIIGPNWGEVLGMGNSNQFAPLEHHRWLAEAEIAPMGPSPWANVAAWSATVGGLMNAQFNLGLESPEFELADLLPIREAIFYEGGERIIDILGPYFPAQATGPGVTYPVNRMSAMWVEPGPVIKYAGQVALTKELLSIDISGGKILAEANAGGFTIRYRESELTIDAIVGTTNNWKLGMLPDASATAYNTYAPTITSQQKVTRTVTNDLVNPFSTPDAMMRSDEAISTLYHPVTDNPIVTQMNVALFPWRMAKWAQWLNEIGEWGQMGQTIAGSAQGAPGQFPNTFGKGKNPWQNQVRPIISRWLQTTQERSATQTDPNFSAGLGLTGNAVYRWYRLDPAKFGCRRQKWGATSTAISASDYQLATTGTAAAFAWDIATMVQVLSPWHIQRNKAA